MFRAVAIIEKVHVVALSPEEEYRAELVLKQRANEAQRLFLRYVFHEVQLAVEDLSRD